MWLVVESEWKAILQSKLEALVATIPQRIKDVIVAGGGNTHWWFGSDFLRIFD
jgi:hypothetical protein